MSNEETILSLLNDVREDVRQIHEKTDAIIQRNSKADANIAVLQSQFTVHENQDAARFTKVEKRIDKHDGFFWKGLVGIIITLTGIVLTLLGLK